jgi:hypothetical protein
MRIGMDYLDLEILPSCIVIAKALCRNVLVIPGVSVFSLIGELGEK